MNIPSNKSLSSLAAMVASGLALTAASVPAVQAQTVRVAVQGQGLPGVIGTVQVGPPVAYPMPRPVAVAYPQPVVGYPMPVMIVRKVRGHGHAYRHYYGYGDGHYYHHHHRHHAWVVPATYPAVIYR